MVYDPYREYRERETGRDRRERDSTPTGNARDPGRDSDERERERKTPGGGGKNKPPPPKDKGKSGGKGGGGWTGSEEHDYKKIEPPPPYPTDRDRDIASGREDASEEEYDAAKSKVRDWREWSQRAGEYKMAMLEQGIVPRMKKSELDMMNTYGQIGIPNIDVLGGYIWDTREGQASDRYADGKTPKGGGWVRMEKGQRKDINDYMKWYQETKEGRDWSKAWGGNSIVGRLVKNQFDKGMSDPNSSMAVGFDQKYKVYWDRGPAQKGDFSKYKFWDQFGRPTSMPSGWTPPTGRDDSATDTTGGNPAAGMKGMNPNSYYLNYMNRAKYALPGQQQMAPPPGVDPNAIPPFTDSKPDSSTGPDRSGGPRTLASTSAGMGTAWGSIGMSNPTRPTDPYQRYRTRPTRQVPPPPFI